MKKQLNEIFDFWKQENLYQPDKAPTLDAWLKDILNGQLICDDDLYSLDWFLQEIYPIFNKDISIWRHHEYHTLQITEKHNEKDYQIMYFNDSIPFKDLDTFTNFLEKYHEKKM